MARTFGGMIFYDATQIVTPSVQQSVGAGAPAATTVALVRNALGDFSWNNAAGANTYNFITGMEAIKRPYFAFPAFPGQGTVLTANEFQELFGASGASGIPVPGNPWSGGQTGSQFGTAAFPWGVSIIDVFAVYSLQTAAATSVTLGLNRATYTENAAFTNAAVLAATAVSAVTTTGAATPHVQKVALAQPLVYESADISNLQIELIAVLPATSLIRVYGLGVHVAVEYS